MLFRLLSFFKYLIINSKWLYAPQAIALGVRRGYIYIYLFIYSHYLSVNIKSLMLLIGGQGILDSIYIHKDYIRLK
jgi:hypothetical protein